MSDFEPRRATAGAHFGYTRPNGDQRDLVADAEGVVHPKDALDAAALDLYGLPVARKALADEKAKEEAKATEETFDKEFRLTKDGPVPRVTNDTQSKPADTGAEG